MTFAQLELQSQIVLKENASRPVTPNSSKKASTASKRKRKRTNGADPTETPTKKPRTKKNGKSVSKTPKTGTTAPQPGGLTTGIASFIANNARAARLIGPVAILRQYNLMGGFTVANAPMTLEEMRSLGDFQQGLTPDAVRLIDNYLRTRATTTATVQPQTIVPTLTTTTATATTTGTRAQRIAAALNKLDKDEDFRSWGEFQSLWLRFKKWKTKEQDKGFAAKLLAAISEAYSAAVSAGNMAAMARLQAAQKVVEMELKDIANK